MATVRQIESNRRNAQKSTGPRTDAGKARSRLNALKHGRRAVAFLPVLPNENPRALARRVQEWTDDFQPATAMERDLLAAAARLLSVHERIEQAEVTGLSHRIEDGLEESVIKRARTVKDLGEDLLSLGWTGSEYVHRTRSGRPPAEIVDWMECSVEGCRWLLAQWAEQRRALDRGSAWTLNRLTRLVRLLGKAGTDAARDEDLNAVVLAVDVLKPGLAKRLWETSLKGLRLGEFTLEEAESWCELAPRPADAKAAREALSALIEERTATLDELIVERQAEHQERRLRWYKAAAIDHSADLEPLHRHRAARHRELIRTVELLRKLRNDPPPEIEPEPEPEGGDPSGAGVLARHSRPRRAGPPPHQEKPRASRGGQGRPPHREKPGASPGGQGRPHH